MHFLHKSYKNMIQNVLLYHTKQPFPPQGPGLDLKIFFSFFCLIISIKNAKKSRSKQNAKISPIMMFFDYFYSLRLDFAQICSQLLLFDLAKQARHAQFQKEFFPLCSHVTKSTDLHRRKVCLI